MARPLPAATTMADVGEFYEQDVCNHRGDLVVYFVCSVVVKTATNRHQNGIETREFEDGHQTAMIGV